MGSELDRPFLESLEEVMSSRQEDMLRHYYRLYFLGSNSFQREPWVLPSELPPPLEAIAHEEAYRRFARRCNHLAQYQWWECFIYTALKLGCFPLACIWKRWRRRLRSRELAAYIQHEYDHSLLRSTRARALHEGLEFAHNSDHTLGYIDLYLQGDELVLLEEHQHKQQQQQQQAMSPHHESHMDPCDMDGDFIMDLTSSSAPRSLHVGSPEHAQARGGISPSYGPPSSHGGHSHTSSLHDVVLPGEGEGHLSSRNFLSKDTVSNATSTSGAFAQSISQQLGHVPRLTVMPLAGDGSYMATWRIHDELLVGQLESGTGGC